VRLIQNYLKLDRLDNAVYYYLIFKREFKKETVTKYTDIFTSLQKEYPKFKETVSIAKKPKTEKGSFIYNTLYVTFAMIIFGLALYYYKNMKPVDEEVF
jgi:hypothetical protein